jgi:hypothetical protein
VHFRAPPVGSNTVLHLCCAEVDAPGQCVHRSDCANRFRVWHCAGRTRTTADPTVKRLSSLAKHTRLAASAPDAQSGGALPVNKRGSQSFLWPKATWHNLADQMRAQNRIASTTSASSCAMIAPSMSQSGEGLLLGPSMDYSRCRDRQRLITSRWSASMAYAAVRH